MDQEVFYWLKTKLILVGTAVLELAGALLLHERMRARELAGCAVMFAAIILVQLPLSAKRPGK